MAAQWLIMLHFFRFWVSHIEVPSLFLEIQAWLVLHPLVILSESEEALCPSHLPLIEGVLISLVHHVNASVGSSAITL